MIHCFQLGQHELVAYSGEDAAKVYEGDAKCPSCKSVGSFGVGCPSCPGFWYDVPNIVKLVSGDDLEFTNAEDFYIQYGIHHLKLNPKRLKDALPTFERGPLFGI